MSGDLPPSATTGLSRFHPSDCSGGSSGSAIGMAARSTSTMVTTGQAPSERRTRPPRSPFPFHRWPSRGSSAGAARPRRTRPPDRGGAGPPRRVRGRGLRRAQADHFQGGRGYVQGRTKAGGWSQQRFARRRANQAERERTRRRLTRRYGCSGQWPTLLMRWSAVIERAWRRCWPTHAWSAYAPGSAAWCCRRRIPGCACSRRSVIVSGRDDHPQRSGPSRQSD